MSKVLYLVCGDKARVEPEHVKELVERYRRATGYECKLLTIDEFKKLQPGQHTITFMDELAVKTIVNIQQPQERTRVGKGERKRNRENRWR